MPSGKPAGIIPRTNVTFSIADATNAKISMLVHDPIAGRGKYGLKSKITDELLQRFFQAYVDGKDEINVRDLRVECQV